MNPKKAQLGSKKCVDDVCGQGTFKHKTGGHSGTFEYIRVHSEQYPALELGVFLWGSAIGPGTFTACDYPLYNINKANTPPPGRPWLPGVWVSRSALEIYHGVFPF